MRVRQMMAPKCGRRGVVGPRAAGYGPGMTDRTPFVPPDERAHSVGATGGLPGANADPRTAEMDPGDIDSTVAAGDAPGSVPDPAEEVADLDEADRAGESGPAERFGQD
jgi:hypothetical protein